MEQEVPEQTPSEPKRTQDVTKKPGCISYGCLTVVLLVLAFVTAGVLTYAYGSSKLNPIAEQFLGLLDNGKYVEAYTLFAPKTKQAQTQEKFVSLERRVHNALGACKNRTLSGVHITPDNGMLTYSATYDKAPASVRVTMCKSGSGWAVTGVVHNSSALLPLLKCERCGKTADNIQDFCGYCGAPMPGVQDQVTTSAK